MEFALLAIGAVCLAGHIAFAVEAAVGRRRIPTVGDDREADALPTACIVVAARNEERAIESALRTHLAQKYPGLEVVVVDDRSDDGTPAVLARMADDHPRLRVVRVDMLPAGWLGKNHALQTGAAATDSEWILFTDADVTLAPDALARAVTLALDRKADHLALGPSLTGGTIPFRVFLTAFVFSFAIFTRPWRVSDPRSRAAIGIGAFNLVRRSAFQSVGGLAPIALRPDDDLMLGRLLKRRGFRSLFARGDGAVEVEWYSTLREAVHGLEKNAFSAFDYSILRMAMASVGVAIFTIWPFVALFVTSGLTRVLYAGAAAIMIAMTAGILRESRLPPAYALALPAGFALFLFAIWRAALINVRAGGIVWRGTLYSLSDIRRNRIP